MHQLVDAEQLLAELPGGVELGEVLAGEAARLDQRHGEGVSERQGGGGRGGGGQPQRTGLAVDRRRQVEVGVAGERGGGVGGHRHQRHAEALQSLDQAEQLRRGPRVRGGEHHVSRHDHPEVAVHRLGGVDEEGRRPRRGEGGGHLLHHQAALPHPRADHPPGAGAQQLDRPVELLVELADQPADRRRLGLQHLGGDLAGSAHVHGIHSACLSRSSEARSFSARSGSSCTAASDLARSGSGWTSRKTPSAPAATAALASGSA